MSELELGNLMWSVLSRIEKVLYENLTVEELEQLLKSR